MLLLTIQGSIVEKLSPYLSSFFSNSYEIGLYSLVEKCAGAYVKGSDFCKRKEIMPLPLTILAQVRQVNPGQNVELEPLDEQPADWPKGVPYIIYVEPAFQIFQGKRANVTIVQWNVRDNKVIASAARVHVLPS